MASNVLRGHRQTVITGVFAKAMAFLTNAIALWGNSCIGVAELVAALAKAFEPFGSAHSKTSIYRHRFPSVMMLCMLARCQHDEIRRGIVCTITIYVMYVFGAFQWTAKHLLHHVSVFKKIAPMSTRMVWHKDSNIAMAVNEPPFECRTTLATPVVAPQIESPLGILGTPTVTVGPEFSNLSSAPTRASHSALRNGQHTSTLTCILNVYARQLVSRQVARVCPLMPALFRYRLVTATLAYSHGISLT